MPFADWVVQAAGDTLPIAPIKQPEVITKLLTLPVRDPSVRKQLVRSGAGAGLCGNWLIRGDRHGIRGFGRAERGESLHVGAQPAERYQQSGKAFAVRRIPVRIAA